MTESGGSIDLLACTPAPPSAPAVVTVQEVWSYGALSQAVDERAEELRREGLGRGAVVPFVAEADLNGLITLLAVWRAGSVALPLHARWTDEERRAAAAGVPATLPAQAVLWTSGTGGRPRGVALSFDNLWASARGAAERLGLERDDLWLASLSPAHVGGLTLLTRAILLGCAVVADGPFDAVRTSDMIDGLGLPAEGPGAVTHVSLVPTQLLRLLDERGDRSPPPGFRCALIGGAHAPRGLVARAHEAGWPLALTYGCTEMTSQIATAEPALARAKPGTVGTALPGVEIRVAADGEILARGATLALGAIAADALAQGAAATTPLAGEDGWYRTGDVGTLEEDGLLRVAGRRSDRIVSGGVTIDAVEVEEALRADPDIADACVVGLPDPEWGERVGACVVPARAGVEPEEVARRLRARLSSPKIPRAWRVVDRLPRNANGKVDRGGIVQRWSEEAAGGSTPQGG